MTFLDILSIHISVATVFVSLSLSVSLSLCKSNIVMMAYLPESSTWCGFCDFAQLGDPTVVRFCLWWLASKREKMKLTGGHLELTQKHVCPLFIYISLMYSQSPLSFKVVRKLNSTFGWRNGKSPCSSTYGMGGIAVVTFGKQICCASHVGEFRRIGTLTSSKNICSEAFICPKSKNIYKLP